MSHSTVAEPSQGSEIVLAALDAVERAGGGTDSQGRMIAAH